TLLASWRKQLVIPRWPFTVYDDENPAGIDTTLLDSPWGARQVAVRENMDPAAQVKTLAHELAHVLMHGPDDEDARQHRGIGEVEAESVALMIGAAHGMDTTGYTIPYVSTWAARVDGKDPVQVVQATGERVRKTALGIVDRLDTVHVGDGIPPGLGNDAATAEQPSRATAPMPERQPTLTVQVRAGRGL
ncbi:MULTISPECIES: ImmA/IrrE family metallo-endopeptidase, partial [unclassified Microbacterium]|uniref:ImmA/IrrE family metallo-endopeptidase n=1 Tax=unclassified Microbacterium TaxID=2609290 RepID=UPI0030174A65